MVVGFVFCGGKGIHLLKRANHLIVRSTHSLRFLVYKYIVQLVGGDKPRFNEHWCALRGRALVELHGRMRFNAAPITAQRPEGKGSGQGDISGVGQDLSDPAGYVLSTGSAAGHECN